jgi:hypothetical protein
MRGGVGRSLECNGHLANEAGAGDNCRLPGDVKRKDTCSPVGVRTGGTGRDGDGGLKVSYITLRNNVSRGLYVP